MTAAAPSVLGGSNTIRLLDVNKRAGFLMELAEHVENEQHFTIRPFTDVIDGLVPAVASALCREPVAAFWDLVAAIAESRAFNGDPAGYAAAHDWSTRETALDRLSDRLQGNVDEAMQRLLGVQS